MEIFKYRKKPVVVEAVQFTKENFYSIAEWVRASHTEQQLTGWLITIPTLEGDMLAKEGDYIIKGIKGEFYPCKADIFIATYEQLV
jgi:hypothetical protein